MENKSTDIEQAITEIVEVLGKHKICIGDLDLVFSGVQSIINRETRIQIPKEPIIINPV